MDARTLIHRAFYSPWKRGEYQNCNVSFAEYGDEVRIYSYSTVVARIVRAIDGSLYTLISDYGYSATTRKHLAWIREASPHTLIYVPDCEDSNMSDKFYKQLRTFKAGQSYNKQIDEFQRASYRNEFMCLIRQLDTYQSYMGDLDEDVMNLRNSQYIVGLIDLCYDLKEHNCSRKEAFAKAEEFFKADEKEFKKEQARLKRKQQREAREYKRKAEERRKKIEGELQLNSENNEMSLDLLRHSFNYYMWDDALTDELRESLRKVRLKLLEIQYDTQEGIRRASYMWVRSVEIASTTASRHHKAYVSIFPWCNDSARCG